MGLNVADQITDTVDIVGERQTTESLDKHNTNGLFVVSWGNVPKTNCKHYSSSPIITPNILFRPMAIFDSSDYHPVLLRV